MTKSMTPFEALEIEMWSLRNARERHATVPVLLDFAVRQRELPLADAVEATMQIFRRYRARYRHNAPTTARTARLVPEIEAYSNGYRAAEGAARISLSEPYVLDIDLIADIEDSGYRQNETPTLPAEEVWPTLVDRLRGIGMVVEMQDDPAQVERTGPFTLNVHTALPGTVPPEDLDTTSAWYVLRLAPELGGPGAADSLAVVAEVLGHIFLAHAPQVWSDPRTWSDSAMLWPPDMPTTSHWWLPSRLVDPDLLTSRHFTEVQAQEAMTVGMVAFARAGLIPHLPDSGALGAVDRLPKEFRWRAVLDAAAETEAMLTGAMPQRMVYPPADDRRTRDLNEP
ncbi:hypothetical protein [Corynebacterium sp.]|uniref:hypothetical protein n=1 Tax=Corynebacterium sp. TaxID=1720 RepID=UPI0025BABA8A|nr:hypothetical protein [Corynebacterium sp.]